MQKGKALKLDELDMIPRYAPAEVMVASVLRTLPVIRWRSYPPGRRETDCPIRPEFTALECVTAAGSRWYGCARAYINSELRMVVIGTNPRDEVRMRWEVVPEDRRA